MSKRIVLITSHPPLAEPFLQDREGRLRDLGVEIPLVVLIRPSMRLHHRVRDLLKNIRRQTRINKASMVAQLVHHFVYRWYGRRPSDPSDASSLQELYRNRDVLEVESGNHPDVVSSIRGGSFELGIVMGADVLSRKTLDTIGLPLFNLHLSDPSFVRGRPPVLWEILDQRDSIQITLHDVVPQLDAGAVLARQDIPISWRRTLSQTIHDTRLFVPEVAADLLLENLLPMLDGDAVRHPVAPGPLCTTPTTKQTLSAERICRRRASSQGKPL